MELARETRGVGESSAPTDSRTDSPRVLRDTTLSFERYLTRAVPLWLTLIMPRFLIESRTSDVSEPPADDLFRLRPRPVVFEHASWKKS